MPAEESGRVDTGEKCRLASPALGEPGHTEGRIRSDDARGRIIAHTTVRTEYHPFSTEQLLEDGEVRSCQRVRGGIVGAEPDAVQEEEDDTLRQEPQRAYASDPSRGCSTT